MLDFVVVEKEWLLTILPIILKNGRLVNNYDKSKDDSFKVKTITIKVIDASEAFMLTQCYRATVNFEYDGSELETKLVVKRTPNVPQELFNNLQFEALFNNEIQFYTNILPKIQRITDGKFSAPKYYYSELKTGMAVIVLQDFAMDSWRVTKDRVGLNLSHVNLAVKYLGNFHGFWYAFKHENRKEFEQITQILKESRFNTETTHPVWELTTIASQKRVIKATRAYQPQVDTEFVMKWVELTANYKTYGRQRVKAIEPLATLCHGDFLRNNVAYRYSDEAIPLDIMMFDYQTMRYSSPMIDLSLFLSISTYAEVRAQHFDNLFDNYYSALIENYEKYAKKSIPDFLSRDALLKEYIHFLPYSLKISSFFLKDLVSPFLRSPEEMFKEEPTEDQVVLSAMTQGGDIVDKELANQMKEMFELSKLHNVEIDENFEY